MDLSCSPIQEHTSVRAAVKVFSYNESCKDSYENVYIYRCPLLCVLNVIYVDTTLYRTPSYTDFRFKYLAISTLILDCLPSYRTPPDMQLM